MRKAFTLVEVLVVLAILATLCGLFVPAFFAMREAARRTEPHDGEPRQTTRLWTVQHDQHWWVMSPDHFMHHPDCPCRSRRPEVE